MKKITRTMKISTIEYLYVDKDTEEIKSGFIKLIEAPEDIKKLLKEVNRLIDVEAIHIKNVDIHIEKRAMSTQIFYLNSELSI